MENKCPKCGRELASRESVARHLEKYCRYRQGKKAKQPVVARQRVAVDIDDGGEFWGDECLAIRTNVSANGRARDYTMCPVDDEIDVECWLNAEKGAVKSVHEKLNEFLVKGRLVLKAWFVKRNPATFEVLRRELFYLSSLPADMVHDFQHWYNRHTAGIIKNLENFQKRDSALELDGIEALEIKFSLLTNLSGRAFFKLPEQLKNKQAVVNVNCNKDCFKYALLSILHYNDLKYHRDRSNNYEKWLDELDFGDIDTSEVHINRDVSKIEKLNNLKINIHVWEKGLQGCVYNDHNVLAEKTVNLLLVVGSEGERHYCGISSLSRLYYHTKNTNNMQHKCERCVRSFKTKESLEEHYQWCARGRLQIEQPPKHEKLTYFTKNLAQSKSFTRTLNPTFIKIHTFQQLFLLMKYGILTLHPSNKRQLK